MKSLPIKTILFGIFLLLFSTSNTLPQTIINKSSYNLTVNGGIKNYVVKIYSSKENFQSDRIFGLNTIDSIIRVIGDSTTIVLNTKRNVLIEVKDKGTSIIDILLLQVDTLKVNGKFHEKLSIYTDNFLNKANHINSITINESYVKTATFKNIALKSLTFKRSKLSLLNLQSTQISNHFSLGQVEIDSANFQNTNLPSFITLDSVNVLSSNPIDLTHLQDIRNPNSRFIFELERTVRISDTDLDNFNLPYDRLNFHVDTAQGIQKRTWIYEKIIKRTQDAGLMTKKDFYSYQLKQAYDQINHGAIRKLVNEVWWSNGGNKTRAVLNIFIIFSVCLLINYIFFNKMTDIYMPQSFSEYQVRIAYKYLVDIHPPDKIKLLGSKIFGVFIYTSYVFWGLKLDLNLLKLKYIPLFVILIGQYIFGLVCVAYLISFIIIK